MTDHEKFKSLLNRLGLTYSLLAEFLGMEYNSVKNQLAPSKELPKWAKTMLLTFEGLEKEYNQLKISP